MKPSTSLVTVFRWAQWPSFQINFFRWLSLSKHLSNSSQYSLFTIHYSLLKTFPQIQVLVSFTAWITSKSSNDFAYKNISKNGYNKKRITAYLKNLIEKQSMLFKWLYFERLHITPSSGLLTNNELWKKNLLYFLGDFIMCIALLYN